MLCYYPLYATVTGAELKLRSDGFELLPGLFAQAGLAEETIFRGFLFRHFRERWPFRSAAVYSTMVFALIHLQLFWTLEPAVAVASTILALSISAPLALLFEKSGGSVWPPAIVHFVIQGSVKILAVPEPQLLHLAIGWMFVAAIAPWIGFLVDKK